ncbi:MAG TPA: hypothetical protein VFZ34_09030, partial [Blastocatellia bacterium]|nr:hypothetical protein [Blastocatellia bacterium]
DLLERAKDICLFEGLPLTLTPELIDSAWRNYFGTAHTYPTKLTGALTQSADEREQSSKLRGFVLAGK